VVLTENWQSTGMGLVRQMAAIPFPTSPLAEPLPSNMATKHAGSGLEEVQPMGVVWRESGVLFLGVTMLPLGVGLRGVRGMVGVVGNSVCR
jgi:hypothetical protein